MQKYDSIAVLGGGSWGTTLAHLLAKNGKSVYLWMRDAEVVKDIKENHKNSKHTLDYILHDNIIPTLNMAEAVSHSEIIIIAIPSEHFRSVSYKLGDYAQGDQILISACKGLDLSEHCTMSEVLKEETCVKKVGVLSGPNLFQEILQGHPAAAVLASKYHEVIQRGLQEINSPDFKIYGSEDMDGVELGGVIKNIIAIASGISDGLGFGINTKALLISRGINEMGRVGIKFGANPLTFTGLAGLGDLMVTCSSPLSRNYRLGFYMAQHNATMKEALKAIEVLAEGVNAARVLYEYSLKTQLDVPIIKSVYEILYNDRPINEVVKELKEKLIQFEIDKTLYNEVMK